MERFELSEIQTAVHPGHPAAPADPVRPDRAGGRAGAAARGDRRADRDPRVGHQAAQRGLRRAGRGGQEVRHRRGARCCWSRPAPPRGRGRAAGGRRRPVPGAAVLDRPAGPHGRRRRRSGRGRPARQARRDRLGGARHRARRRRRGHLGRAAAAADRDRPARAAADRPPRRTWRAARRCREFLALEPDERVLGLTTLDESSPGLALGTAQGVVKRVVPDYPANKDEFEVIGLKEGDRVVGAVELRTGEEDLVFITDDAQLLRYPARQVRPQGRPAGGMAGIKLADGVEGALASPRSTRRPTRWCSRSPARRGTLDGSGQSSCEAHPVRPVSAQGPGHRRRALPAVPAGRGQRWCSPGRVRHRPARRRRPARRSSCRSSTRAATARERRSRSRSRRWPGPSRNVLEILAGSARHRSLVRSPGTGVAGEAERRR